MEIIEICVIYIAAVVTIIAFRQREKQSGGGMVDAIILYSYCDEWDKFREM